MEPVSVLRTGGPAGLEVYRPKPNQYNETPDRWHTSSTVPAEKSSSVTQRGLSSVNLLLLASLILAIAAIAAMGGGLGATLSSCREEVRKVKSSTPSGSCSATTSSTTSSALLSDRTAVSSSTTSSAPLSDYTAVSPSTIESLHNDCTPGASFTDIFGNTYAPACNKDFYSGGGSVAGAPIVTDIVGIIAYSWADCISACSSLTAEARKFGHPTECWSITFRTDMKSQTALQFANCWLKSGVDADIASLAPDQNAHSARRINTVITTKGNYTCP